ncbi:MAG: hypothetical protein LBC09_02910, partial [Helicobacteraceae bacterium]|nr:hypothetical protein [Helicobacteraceae bacterium]
VYLEGSQVPYLHYEQDGAEIWRFDTSAEACPTPMVSALEALKLIDAPNKRLIMINHSRPNALIARAQNSYKIAVKQTSDGLFEIAFDYKPDGAAINANEAACLNAG